SGGGGDAARRDVDPLALLTGKADLAASSLCDGSAARRCTHSDPIPRRSVRPWRCNPLYGDHGCPGAAHGTQHEVGRTRRVSATSSSGAVWYADPRGGLAKKRKTRERSDWGRGGAPRSRCEPAGES